MSRAVRVIVGVVLVVTVLPLILIASQSDERSRGDLKEVFVSNWPNLWNVQGEVAIKGPVRQASLVALKDIVVPPVGPKDTTRLILAGTITTDGFSHMVVSVAGELKGEHARAGTIGAFLMPQEELMKRAFDEQGQLLFAVEVKASAGSPNPAYFASEQPRSVIGFPRYAVYLYNTTDKSASVSVYAYLTN